MASNFAPQTNEPVTQWYSTPDDRQLQQHPYSSAPDADNNADDGSHSSAGSWEAGLFACCSSPMQLVTATLFPCASGAYSACGIKKFPIAIGTALGVFFYGAAAFIALTIIDDDQPSVTVGGMEFKAWQTGAGWALANFLGIVFLLRGWFRAFYGIPGSKFYDLPASCLLSCCALAQMSKHTAKVHKQQQLEATKSTLQGYAA